METKKKKTLVYVDLKFQRFNSRRKSPAGFAVKIMRKIFVKGGKKREKKCLPSIIRYNKKEKKS